jgi:HEAT repeat protein
LPADEMAECERAAVRKCLEERVFSKQVAAQSNSVAYCVQAMQHVPGFLDEAVRAATHAIESDESDSRVRGFYLMAAARLDSAAMKDRAVERLGDRDFTVRAAAADALGALGINESRVIEKLRGMVDSKQPEPVRTAGVRNLALLAPQDPEIVKLIQSLAEDANFGTRTEARRALRMINSSQ